VCNWKEKDARRKMTNTVKTFSRREGNRERSLCESQRPEQLRGSMQASGCVSWIQAVQQAVQWRNGIGIIDSLGLAVTSPELITTTVKENTLTVSAFCCCLQTVYNHGFSSFSCTRYLFTLSSSLSLRLLLQFILVFFSVFFARMVINLFRKRGGRVFLWSCVPRSPPC